MFVFEELAPKGFLNCKPFPKRIGWEVDRQQYHLQWYEASFGVGNAGRNLQTVAQQKGLSSPNK
eukprot:1619523-Amphidinium_carterae.1